MFKEADELFEKLRNIHLQGERHFFSLLVPSKVHPTAEGKWLPLADVYETDVAWVIKLELAGVRKGDFSVTANEGIVTIKGTRRDEFEGEWRTYHQAEINYHEFERSFPLPKGTDAGDITALYNNGLLTITITKRPSPPRKRKTITITIT